MDDDDKPGWTGKDKYMAQGFAALQALLPWVFPDGCRSATGEYPNDGNIEHVGAKHDPQHLGYWALP